MSSGSEDSDAEAWVQWFCKLPGNEFFCEVERSYIEDAFNLYGLKATVPHFHDCLSIILDRAEAEDMDDPELKAAYAAQLYGLIHARFIVTSHGLNVMHSKFRQADFGTCPRVLCSGQRVLPIGTTLDPRHDSVKIFCPKCGEVYAPSTSHSTLDGAFFGPTFPHLFFMSFDEEVPSDAPQRYVPRVFGFRVHPSSASVAHLNRSRDRDDPPTSATSEPTAEYSKPSDLPPPETTHAQPTPAKAQANVRVVVVPDRNRDKPVPQESIGEKRIHEPLDDDVDRAKRVRKVVNPSAH